MGKTDILGMEFDAVTMDETLEKIDAFIRSGAPHKIFCPNVALYVWSRSDPELRRFYESCDLLPSDGMGIYYAARLLGSLIPESVSAVFIFFRLLELPAEKGYKFYFLGSKEEVLLQAIKNARERYPGINIVGSRNGYFSLEDEPGIVEDIRSSGADVLFLGMSTPMKERFVERNMEKMAVPVSLGVGGSFDVLAGVCKLAPLWMRKAGLEWFYRLIQEPGRMWKRYLTTNAVFGYLVFKEMFKKPLRRITSGG